VRLLIYTLEKQVLLYDTWGRDDIAHVKDVIV
jgi:hypothetical protein